MTAPDDQTQEEMEAPLMLAHERQERIDKTARKLYLKRAVQSMQHGPKLCSNDAHHAYTLALWLEDARACFVAGGAPDA